MVALAQVRPNLFTVNQCLESGPQTVIYFWVSRSLA